MRPALGAIPSKSTEAPTVAVVGSACAGVIGCHIPALRHADVQAPFLQPSAARLRAGDDRSPRYARTPAVEVKAVNGPLKAQGGVHLRAAPESPLLAWTDYAMAFIRRRCKGGLPADHGAPKRQNQQFVGRSGQAHSRQHCGGQKRRATFLVCAHVPPRDLSANVRPCRRRWHIYGSTVVANGFTWSGCEQMYGIAQPMRFWQL